MLSFTYTITEERSLQFDAHWIHCCSIQCLFFRFHLNLFTTLKSVSQNDERTFLFLTISYEDKQDIHSLSIFFQICVFSSLLYIEFLEYSFNVFWPFFIKSWTFSVPVRNYPFIPFSKFPNKRVASQFFSMLHNFIYQK